MSKTRVWIVLSVAMLSTLTVYGEDSVDNWPTWRGIDCTGISRDGDPPIQWSETKNIKWKVELTGDPSNSTPIVWNEKIIFQTAVKDDKNASADLYQFNLVCLDRETGNPLWEKTVTQAVPHQGHHRDHGFTSFSPVTDGHYVWAYFGSRGIYCYDLNGNKIWEKNMPKMDAQFGEGGAPALAGDALIAVADHKGDSVIYAFNKHTGDVIWEKARDEDEITYSTPLPVEVNGKLQVVVNSWNKIISYDAQTGDVIWECGGPQRNAIHSPVIGDGVIYCATQVDTHIMQALKLNLTGDLSQSGGILWQNKNAGTPDIPSLLLYKNRLYSFWEFNEEISCYNPANGQPYFEKQQLDEMRKIYASPVAAADRIYCTGRNGVTYVLKASDQFEVLAVNKLDDPIDCSPVIVGEELYLKSKKHLYCIVESH